MKRTSLIAAVFLMQPALAHVAYASPYQAIQSLFGDIVQVLNNPLLEDDFRKGFKAGVDFNALANSITKIPSGYLVQISGDRPIPERNDAGIFCEINSTDTASIDYLKSLKTYIKSAHFRGPIAEYRKTDLERRGDGRSFYLLVSPCSASTPSP